MKKVLRFTATWCQPCKMLTKILENVTTELPIEVIDIDEQSDLAVKYSIRSVPTLVMIEDDKEIRRMSGVKTKDELTEWFND